jgi:hypothetical protein
MLAGCRVNHGNRNQRAEHLGQDGSPFDKADLCLADDNALTPRFHSPFQGSYDFALGRRLKGVSWVEAQHPLP